MVAYDLRGSGQSEVTPGPYTIDLLADDLRALVEALEPRARRSRRPLDGRRRSRSPYAARYPRDVRAAGRGRRACGASPTRRGQGMAATSRDRRGGGHGARSPRRSRRTASPRRSASSNPEEFQELIAMLAANDPQRLRGPVPGARRPRPRRPAGRDHGSRAALISGDRDGVSPPAVTEANAALDPGRPASRSSRTAATS